MICSFEQSFVRVFTCNNLLREIPNAHQIKLRDSRNKYPEIEDLVIREVEPVYLTKNEIS